MNLCLMHYDKLFIAELYNTSHEENQVLRHLPSLFPDKKQKYVASEITFRNCIRARVSFGMQPCLLCAGLVTSYLSKWSTGTICQSFCKNR